MGNLSLRERKLRRRASPLQHTTGNSGAPRGEEYGYGYHDEQEGYSKNWNEYAATTQHSPSTPSSYRHHSSQVQSYNTRPSDEDLTALIEAQGVFAGACEIFKSDNYAKYTRREHSEKCKKTGLPIWSPRAEALFQQIMLLLPPIFGRRQIQCLFRDGTKEKKGRNELIAHYIEENNKPVPYGRKTISSHIQVVVKQLKTDENEAALQRIKTNHIIADAIKKKDMWFDEATMTLRVGSITHSLASVGGSNVLPDNLAQPILDRNGQTLGWQANFVQSIDFVMRTYKEIANEHGLVQALTTHICTRLQSQVGAAAKEVKDIESYFPLFPPLQTILDNDKTGSCAILWFDSSIDPLSELRADGSKFGVEFKVDLACEEEYTDWTLQTNFYHDYGRPSHSRRCAIRVEPSLANPKSVRAEIILHSSWWVKLSMEIIRRKKAAGQELEDQLNALMHGACNCEQCIILRQEHARHVEAEDENCRRFFDKMSVIQEIFATPKKVSPGQSKGPRRLAIFLWKFRQTRPNETALTTWQRVARDRFASREFLEAYSATAAAACVPAIKPEDAVWPQAEIGDFVPEDVQRLWQQYGGDLVPAAAQELNPNNYATGEFAHANSAFTMITNHALYHDVNTTADGLYVDQQVQHTNQHHDESEHYYESQKEPPNYAQHGLQSSQDLEQAPACNDIDFTDVNMEDFSFDNVFSDQELLASFQNLPINFDSGYAQQPSSYEDVIVHIKEEPEENTSIAEHEQNRHDVLQAVHAPQPRRIISTAHLSSPILLQSPHGLPAEVENDEACDATQVAGYQAEEEICADGQYLASLTTQHHDLQFTEHVTTIQHFSTTPVEYDFQQAHSKRDSASQGSVYHNQRQSFDTNQSVHSTSYTQDTQAVHIGGPQQLNLLTSTYEHNASVTTSATGSHLTAADVLAQHFTSVQQDHHGYEYPQAHDQHIYAPLMLPSQHCIPTPSHTSHQELSPTSFSDTAQAQKAYTRCSPNATLDAHAWVLDLAIAQTESMIEHAHAQQQEFSRGSEMDALVTAATLGADNHYDSSLITNEDIAAVVAVLDATTSDENFSEALNTPVELPGSPAGHVLGELPTTPERELEDQFDASAYKVPLSQPQSPHKQGPTTTTPAPQDPEAEPQHRSSSVDLEALAVTANPIGTTTSRPKEPCRQPEHAVDQGKPQHEAQLDFTPDSPDHDLAAHDQSIHFNTPILGHNDVFIASNFAHDNHEALLDTAEILTPDSPEIEMTDVEDFDADIDAQHVEQYRPREDERESTESDHEWEKIEWHEDVTA